MKQHRRKSIRLKGYDYAQAGAYFITICTQNRAHLFGDIVDGCMVLNDAGTMVANIWLGLSQRFYGIQLHDYIVMPNHFHGIIEIPYRRGNPCGCPNCDFPNGSTDIKRAPTNKRAPTRGAPTYEPTVGDMVGGFKSLTTNAYICGVKQSGWLPFDQRIWQRNYWEHIVRNAQEFERISQYIRHNPAQWQRDPFNARRGNPCGCPNDYPHHHFPNNETKEPQSEYGVEAWMV